MSETDHFREAERLLRVCAGPQRGSDLDAICTAAAQVHATLATAPVWLRCVDHLYGTGAYVLNPAHVVYIDRSKDGWWQALDVTGRAHRIDSDDDAKVEALIAGSEASA